MSEEKTLTAEELAAMRAIGVAWCTEAQFDALFEHISALERQLAVDARDAARWRWLSSGACYWAILQSQPCGDVVYDGPGGTDHLERAIDASLSALQGGGGGE